MAMYEKNLSEDLRLRLTADDMNFLKDLSEKRSQSVSECIRSIIGEYRRSIESLSVLSDAMKLLKEKKGGLSDGDTKTDFVNQL